jgi:hypothetical protein
MNEYFHLDASLYQIYKISIKKSEYQTLSFSSGIINRNIIVIKKTAIRITSTQ